VYNPAIFFFNRAPLFLRTRFLIGAWLNVDFDWRGHQLFYHGWESGRSGWIDRSRPHIHATDVYVNPRYRNVVINRTVVDRRVNYRALNRYDDVHRNANFDTFRATGRIPPNTPPETRQVPVTNKIIDRNINTRDPRINEYRGHSAGTSSPLPVPATPAFTPERGGFDPRQASHRGEISRGHASPPRPPAPPPPARQHEEQKKKH
jgi:hypothetical protein